MGKIFFILCLFIPYILNAQSEKIKVLIPSPDTESEYIWMNIKDISFFEANNYDLSLPDVEFIEVLKEKSRNNILTDADLDSLKVIMKEEVFNTKDYLKGSKMIWKKGQVIDIAINELTGFSGEWEFKIFDEYEVTMTLYGPGGSYNPENGNIIIMCTPSGKFRGYSDPSYTIIHEIVHMGIEESIMEKYNVPHALKERIVDLFVKVYFGGMLPDYELQNFGDQRINNYLINKNDFKKLPFIIEKFMKENY